MVHIDLCEQALGSIGLGLVLENKHSEFSCNVFAGYLVNYSIYLVTFTACNGSREALNLLELPHNHRK